LIKGGMVLDLGCGNGSWTMEMAADYPNTSILGIDTNQVFPETVMPPNCDFDVVDATGPLPYADNTFDLVYIREMVTAIPGTQWNGMLKEVYRVLKPDGWIQANEIGPNFMNLGPVSNYLIDTSKKGLDKGGYDTSISGRLPELLTAAGYADVDQVKVETPLGSWGGTLGTLLKEDFYLGIVALKNWIVLMMGVSGEKWEADAKIFLVEAEEYKTYGELFACYGRKAA